MNRALDHTLIFATIFLATYSQLVMRWQVGAAGPLPPDWLGRMHFVISLLLSPWALSAVVATFFGGVSWMLVMTKFEVSYALPFVSLTYVLVLAASVWLFNESLSAAKLSGTALVMLGLIVIAQG